jgi:cytochrome c peroxidase
MENQRASFTKVISLAGMLMLLAGAAWGQSLTDKEQLGKSIFFDTDLSINFNQACAACHSPATGFTGPRSGINALGAVYEGSIAGRFGNRKPPSASYATQSPILNYVLDHREALFIGGNFWDGRATGETLGNPAADQALGPFLNSLEQALPDHACVVYRVCTASYPVGFETVWGAGTCQITWPADVGTTCAMEGGVVSLSPEDRAKVNAAYGAIGLSAAAYEASREVNQFTSKFDYYLKGMAVLTREERKGLAIFSGKGKCTNCHTIGKGAMSMSFRATSASGRLRMAENSLLTDFTYDNLGVPKNPENPFYASNPSFIDEGLGGFLSTRVDYQMFAPENMGKQKVPSLRNVDKRPFPEFVKAYTHNGYFKTLEGIVHFYNTRDVKPVCPGAFTEAQALAADCWPEPEVSENVNDSELGNLHLTPDQEAAIVAFLKTLSDGFSP